MIAWILPLLSLLLHAPEKAEIKSLSSAATEPIVLADPTIFLYKDTFYLYGTGANKGEGFSAYTSTDLSNWNAVARKNGLVLQKGESFGDKGFWAPQVFPYKNKFYFAYTANEQIAIATADHPAGPFKQATHQSIHSNGKQIDPFLFEDRDGTVYLYFVKLQEGNRLFVGKMKPDLSDIVPETVQPVLAASLNWENTQQAKWPVTEGPTVFYRDGSYHLLYSANDYRNIDYAVGYASSKSPMGPWIKSTAAPFISRLTTGWNGSGHGDLFQHKDGQFYYVFHTHNSQTQVQPRKTALVKLKYSPNANTIFEIDSSILRQLNFLNP